MFVILIKKTLGSGFKYSAFHYCDPGRISTKLVIEEDVINSAQSTPSSFIFFLLFVE